MPASNAGSWFGRSVSMWKPFDQAEGSTLAESGHRRDTPRSRFTHPGSETDGTAWRGGVTIRSRKRRAARRKSSDCGRLHFPTFGYNLAAHHGRTSRPWHPSTIHRPRFRSSTGGLTSRRSPHFYAEQFHPLGTDGIAFAVGGAWGTAVCLAFRTRLSFPELTRARLPGYSW